MKLTRQWLDVARARGYRLHRGSIIILTLFVATGMSFIVGSLLQANLQEQTINRRAVLTMEAKNAVDSATEYIISQIRLRFDNYPGITGNYFLSNPTTIPSTVSDFLWTGTNVTAANVTTKIGIVPAAAVLYIDPANPANAFDPDRGKNVSACDVYVYAQATAVNSIWKASVTAYGTQALEVRNSPLFTHAIFYTMDLEFHPGPAMSVTGPVHSNGNIWAVAQNALTFSGPVTTTGNFNVGMIPWPTSWGSSSESAQTGADVFIPNNSGGYTSPYKGTGSQQVSSSYWDSRQGNYTGTSYNNWREMSANLWGGNLQSSANGVPDEQVTGYNDFVYKVNGTSQDLNYAYAIIEPAQNTKYANATTNPFNLGTGENVKFERQASIIVKPLTMGTANITTTKVVNGNLTGNSVANTTAINANIATNQGFINTTVATLSTTGNFTTSGGNMVISGSLVLANGSTQTLSGNLANPVIGTNSTAFPLVTQTQNKTTVGGSENTLMEVSTSSFSSSANKTTITTTRYVGVAYVELDTLKTTINATTNALEPVYNGSTTLTNAYGDVTYPGDIIEQPIAVNASQITSAGSLQDVIKFRPGIGNMSGSGSYSGNTSDVWNGMFDQRRNQLISTLDVDVGKLKLLVDNNTAGYASNSSAFFNGTGNLAFDPTKQYNGVVYVEFPELPGNASRLNSVAAGNQTYPGDAILDSIDGAGLVLTNATSTAASTGVPNPNYANTTIGQAGRVNGFTVATNNCVYIVGNYNADGNMSTPATDTTANQQTNDTMPDVPAHPDPACCIAGDSVTALSGAWLNRVSGTSYTNLNATPTEVNTAILGGIVPSLKSTSTQESGGSHNFPRFLEDWSGGVVFRYRGSMVCLYESELGNDPWSTNYYAPPNREWGFYNQFARGIYPPGTPNARSFYRVNFSYLTSSQYTTATAGL